ncbi:MAG: hypothetical protein OHK0040_11510 [bacterium]
MKLRVKQIVRKYEIMEIAGKYISDISDTYQTYIGHYNEMSIHKGDGKDNKYGVSGLISSIQKNGKQGF